MRKAAMKVGTLAKKTGLTVRTLHYYEEIGLLAPAQRTEAGHRLYGVDEVARLHQVVSLRRLGFPLEDIRDCLDQPAFSIDRVIALHLSRLREQIAMQQQLCRRLETIAAHLRVAEDVSVDDFIQTIAVMTMFEKYYTPDQLDYLKKRGEMLGEERIRQSQTEWQELIAAVRAAKEEGVDPAGERMQALAQRWKDLIEAFTGGDPGIAQSLKTMYQQEGAEKASRGMVDADLSAFVGKAMESLQQPE